MFRKTSFYGLLLLMFAAVSYAESSLPAVSAEHENPVIINKQIAVVFSKKSPNLTVKKAYSLQKAYVKNSVAKGVDIVGFKAGLTTTESARAYGLDGPISGVLLQAPLRGNNASVSIKDTINLMLEQEFAYQISQTINEKITEDQLMDYVSGVAPAIEIPQLNFMANEYTGMDIIANNAMAYKVMIGDWQSPKSMKNLDGTKVSLTCNGQTLAQGKGSNASQGQVNALLWLINHMIDQGYKIQKGQILITGNLIKMVPAKPCVYTADYGQMGKLSLTVTD